MNEAGIADRYVCCDAHRRAAWLKPGAPANISGIDYIEVRAGLHVSDDSVIDIHLVKSLPRTVGILATDQVRIGGGVRFPAPLIGQVDAVPASGPITGYRVLIPGGQQTDFSTYRLILVDGPETGAPPAFIDPRLATVDFSFKLGCATDADCATDCSDIPDDPGREIVLDYRTRDYQGFRNLLLDRMRSLVPGFREDDPSDLTTTLIEMLAYRADQQSYRLDWVGTEAFLSTARSRASITRHARLVDYPVGEGASARVFAQFAFHPGVLPDGTLLPASTPLLIRDAALPGVIAARDYRLLSTRQPLIFETMAPTALWEWRNAPAIHSWGDGECRLPRGARAVTLVWPGAGGRLAAGDLLLLKELKSPEKGTEVDANPAHRHVVRLTAVRDATDPLAPSLSLLTVEWDQADALPFDLVIAPHVEPGGTPPTPGPYAGLCANIMLCDHGMSAPPSPALALPAIDIAAMRPLLDPPAPQPGIRWQPTLDRANLSRVAHRAKDVLPSGPASTLTLVDAGEALPVIALRDDFAPWTARRDLLESSAYDRDFVVETGMDGRASLRFGDGRNGAIPVPGAILVPAGRIGTGLAGNIGADALGHVVLKDGWVQADIRVTNPLPAHGGADPEPVAQIRTAAPQAFRRQERAVTTADYAEVAMRHPQVSNALAIPRWTGAWQTMLVAIDRLDGAAVDRAFRNEMLRHMERYRLMGFDVAIEGAQPAPLEIRLSVCARPGELRSQLAGRVRNALRPRSLATGEPGFFHPDRFTFGTILYLSQLVEAVMAVDGVLSVSPQLFKRLGRIPQGELESGVIRPAGTEVLELADDPNFPERGVLQLVMGGGR